MKKITVILPLALILCFVVGCQDKEAMAELEEFRAQAEVEEQNKALIERYYQQVDKGNIEAVLAMMDELFAPDYIYHTSIYEHGLEKMKEHYSEWMAIVGDTQHKIEEMIADGNIVAIRFTFQARHKGEFLGVPATGKQVMAPISSIWRFKDGKVKEIWDYGDSSLSLMQQLGMELKPKEGEE